MSYTEDELKMLSAEEREAMTEGREDTGAEDTVDAGIDEAAAEEAAPEAAVAQTEESPEKVEIFTHHYQAPPVEGYEEKSAAFAAQKAELRRQLNGGDIELDDYEAQKDSIVSQEMSLREQKLKADISAEQNEQSGKARWQWDQEQFFGAKENALYQDEFVLAAFDAAVRKLGNDAANADQNGQWFLREADKLVRARFGVAAPATQQRQQDGRKPDLSVVPKTLAHLPSADIPQTGDVDEFAHIDRLQGLELEKAVGRLSESERERYRAAA